MRQIFVSVIQLVRASFLTIYRLLGRKILRAVMTMNVRKALVDILKRLFETGRDITTEYSQAALGW